MSELSGFGIRNYPKGIDDKGSQYDAYDAPYCKRCGSENVERELVAIADCHHSFRCKCRDTYKGVLCRDCGNK
jgi:hypothetical protein